MRVWWRAREDGEVRERTLNWILCVSVSMAKGEGESEDAGRLLLLLHGRVTST